MRRRDNTCRVEHCPNCGNEEVCRILICECGFIGCRSHDLKDGCFGERCPWCHNRYAFRCIGIVVLTPKSILHASGLGPLWKTALLALYVVTSEKTGNFLPSLADTIALDSLWSTVKATHDEEEARKLEERKVTARCQCATCIAEREEKERQRKEKEEEDCRRRQQEENDYYYDDDDD